MSSEKPTPSPTPSPTWAPVESPEEFACDCGPAVDVEDGSAVVRVEKWLDVGLGSFASSRTTKRFVVSLQHPEIEPNSATLEQQYRGSGSFVHWTIPVPLVVSVPLL